MLYQAFPNKLVVRDNNYCHYKKKTYIKIIKKHSSGLHGYSQFTSGMSMLLKKK